jgi:tetrahydromethanopterin S-methyltransferase subunit C
MQDPQIRATTAASVSLWIIGFTLIAIGTYTDQNGIPGMGIMSGLAAVLVYIRGLFVEHNRCLREAFDAGRDYERHRSDPDVRSLH